MAENKNQVQNEEDIITLEFDDGEDIECEIMGIFDYDGNDYIALIPLDDSDDVYIYGYREVGEDEFEIVDILDDELFKNVVGEFEAIMAESEE
ncbi:MAG: DUF1292 domain-containing protein [Firmicutes bacterium]|nr:DUF1292 domain-containing protein [Bacillota bacterium]